MGGAYIVHARGEGRHRAYQVEDAGAGERHCLTIDLVTGETGACD